MSNRIEYKLYKTKSKLSSLLGQSTPNQTSSYYIFVELTPAEDGFDSIWFNRSTAEVTYKKGKVFKRNFIRFWIFY